MGKILLPQRSLLTLLRHKGGDFLIDYVGAGGSYSVALWDGDDLKASPKSTQWVDRIGGHVIDMYDRYNNYTVTEADPNVNGHNSVSFPNAPDFQTGANARNTTAYLEIDGATPVDQAWTFYIVMKPIAKVGNRYYWASGLATAQPVYAQYQATPAIRVVQGSTSLGSINPIPAIGEWFAWSVMMKEGTMTSKMRVNDNAITQASMTEANGSPFRGISLNINHSAITTPTLSSGVGVACILMRQGEDSEAETLEINNYLMAKYGI